MAMQIDSDTCTACGDCLPLCPTKSISAGKIFYKIDAATCTECEGEFDMPQCVNACMEDNCIVPA